MPIRRDYRAFIFDLDDTIIHSESLNVELIKETYKNVWHVDLDRDDEDFVFGHSWADIYGHLILKYNLETDIDTVQSEVIMLKRKWLEKNRLETATGILKVLKIPARKVIVSGSGASEIQMMLANVKLLDFFENFFSAENYGRGKPEPDGFLMALDYLRLPAKDVLIFEDSLSGVAASKKAGMDCVFIAEFAESDASKESDMAFDTFEDFYKFYSGE